MFQRQPATLSTSSLPVCDSTYFVEWLPILVCAEKVGNYSLVCCTKRRTKTVEQNRIGKRSHFRRESQFGVSMVRSMVERIYWKGKFWVWSERVKEWWMEKVEKRRMDWDKHKEMMKLVHEVKQEVCPRGEARHWKLIWSLLPLGAAVKAAILNWESPFFLDVRGVHAGARSFYFGSMAKPR